MMLLRAEEALQPEECADAQEVHRLEQEVKRLQRENERLQRETGVQ